MQEYFIIHHFLYYFNIKQKFRQYKLIGHIYLY